MVLAINIAIVIGPTPPGTGVIADALALTSSKATSPTSLVPFLAVKSSNLAVEYGFGIDMYYPLFKLSPEIRISHGIRNMKKPNVYNKYTVPLDRVVTHSVTLYLMFE